VIGLLLALGSHLLLLWWLRDNMRPIVPASAAAVLEVEWIPAVPVRADPPPLPPPPSRAIRRTVAAPAAPPPRPTAAPAHRSEVMIRESGPPAPLDLRLPEPDVTPSYRSPALDAARRQRLLSGTPLPGRTEAFARIDGMRDRVTPADLVGMIAAITGGGHRDGCAEIEQRLLDGATGTAREIDLAKWRKRCGR